MDALTELFTAAWSLQTGMPILLGVLLLLAVLSLIWAIAEEHREHRTLCEHCRQTRALAYDIARAIAFGAMTGAGVIAVAWLLPDLALTPVVHLPDARAGYTLATSTLWMFSDGAVSLLILVWLRLQDVRGVHRWQREAMA